MKKFFVALFYFLSLNLFAQEVCDDLVDNDGDGLIDCFDGDCIGSSACEGSFFGNDAVCQMNPTEFPDFSIKQKWASGNMTSDNLTYPAVGDLNGDGLPELVVGNSVGKTISILNGTDGSTLNSVTLSFSPGRSIAIADVDLTNGNCGEIFVRAFEDTNIEAYDCELNLLWSINTNSLNGNPGLLSLADFNQDGNVELFHHNEIIDAMTGNVIIRGSGSFNSESAFGTVAVDVLPDAACDDCSGLELIDGNKIYAVDISNATLTEVRNMNDVLASTSGVPAGAAFFHKISTLTGQKTMVSPADFNQDGNIDVLLTGALGFGSDDQTTIFFWDIANEIVDFYQDPSSNFTRGSGRIAVADVDGDGKLNATFVMNQQLISLDENLNPIWTKGIVEGSSGISGCSTFDFNGDGTSEILYRSESTFHIIDGIDGSTINQVFCQSRTWIEYPIIADIDGDGKTEICVTCSTNDNSAFDPFEPNALNGQVRVYEADGENWLPSRSVWNQHAYLNVNVNDDLTIPIVQQNPAVSFSTTLCDGTVGDNQALNRFLGQSTLLNSNGCPNLSGNDISLQGVTLMAQPLCVAEKFEVEVTLRNNGNFNMNKDIPVTFYNGDPETNSAFRLNTELLTLENLMIDETANYTLPVELDVSEFQLFIVVNDDGTQNLPLVGIGSVINECDFDNNIQNIQVKALPFPLSIEKIADNQVCDNNLLANGSARTFFFGEIPGDSAILWSEDFDDLMIGDMIDEGETAWSFILEPNLPTSDAQVFNVLATNSFVGSNLDSELIWTSEEIAIDDFETIFISADLISSSNLESNQDYFSFSYKIDDGAEILLNNGNVTGSIEGNTVNAEITIPNNQGNTLQIVARLFNTAIGEIYAFDNVLVKGVNEPVLGEITEGYTFQWYEENDYSSALYEGSLQENLPHGAYSVIGTNNSTGCNSDTAVLIINLDTSIQFSVEIEETNPVTNCENPNGTLTASVLQGGLIAPLEDYDFTWFYDDFFIDTVAEGSIAAGLEAREYTIAVREKATGCITSESAFLSINLVIPALEVNVLSNVVDCANLLSGEVTATSNGLTEGFTFEWFDGEFIKEEPDFVGPTYGNLQSGNYTVQARNNDSQCISEPMTVNILDETMSFEVIYNDFVSNTTGNNGGVRVSALTDGLISPGGYNFEFFSGDHIDPNNQLFNGSPAHVTIMNVSSNELTISGLSDGVYTVMVEDLTSECLTISQFEISDEFPPALPIILSPSIPVKVNAEVMNITGVSEKGALISIVNDFNGNNMIDSEGDFDEIAFQLMENETDFSIEVILSQNSDNNFLVTATDENGNTSVPADVPTITEESILIRWQGGALGAPSDWGNSFNWVGGSIPNLTNDVLIPNTENSPMLINSSFAINDMEIQDGATLEILSGGGLAIMGHVNLEGSGIVHIARNTVSNLGFSTIGSPISIASIDELNQDFVFKYDEEINSFQEATGNMLPGQGFFVASDVSDASIEFFGNPNTGIVNYPLSLITSSNEIMDGFNLVSNPYTAAINRNAFIAANDQRVINGTIWIWDDGGSNNSEGRTGDYLVITNAGVASSNPEIEFTTTTPISSMQGFFVLADRHAGNLVFDPLMQVTSENLDQNFFREEKELTLQQSIKLSLSGRGELADLYNEILIGIDDRGTFGDDYLLDGLKFSGNQYLSLYSIQKDQQYAIQVIPPLESEVSKIALGFYLSESGDYQIDLKESQLDNEHFTYYLTDKYTDKSYDLSLETTIGFRIIEQGRVDDRFVLEIIPKLVTIIANDASSNLSIIRGDNKGLTISYPSNREQVLLYDLNGKKLLDTMVEFDSSIAEVNYFMKRGQVYLIRVKDDIIKFSLK